MKKTFFIALAWAAASALFFAQSTKPLDPPRRTVDVKHVRLDLTLDEKAGTLKGTATHTVVPLWDDVEEILFHAMEMEIEKITLKGKTLKFTRDEKTGELRIALGKKYGKADTLDIAIAYNATPRRGIYFVRPDEGYPEKPYQIWTQGEAEESRYWFPCHDYPNERATSEANVTVRKPYIVIGNGALMGVDVSKDGAWRTFRWKIGEPHVAYLVSLIVGEFEELKAEYDGIPLQYFVQKKDVEHAMNSFRKTPAMMKFFNDYIGVKYPYEKYAQTPVEDFMWGGMENVSATTLSQGTIHDARAHASFDENSDGLVAHELAHQWWGDLLTCRDWSHIWLNEGFATYFDALWVEHDLGKDDYKWELRGSRGWNLGQARWKSRPVVWRGYEDAVDMFDSYAYGKGSWILHMLRALAGDRDFQRGIQLYAQRHQNQVVTTNDLRLTFEDATGKNLDWFFEQWTARVGHPKFNVKWEWDEESEMAVFHVRQTQGGEPFRAPLDIEITTPKGARSYRVALDGTEQKIYLPVSEKPLFVAFDKDGKILKEIEFERSEEELLEQLVRDSDVLGRLDAAEGLAKYPSSRAVAALVKAVKEDAFHGVRREIASLLGGIHSDEAKAALLGATRDKDARVRGAAVSALGGYKGEAKEDAVARLKETFAGDESYNVQANSLRALAKLAEKSKKKSAESTEGAESTKSEESAPSAPPAQDEKSPALSEDELKELLKKALEMPSHKEVIRRAAIAVQADLKGDEALATVKEWMAYGKPSWCRTEAMKAFVKLSKADAEKTARELLPYLKDKSHWMRGEAVSSLERLKQPLAVPHLIELAEKDPVERVRLSAKRAVKALQSGAASTTEDD